MSYDKTDLFVYLHDAHATAEILHDELYECEDPKLLEWAENIIDQAAGMMFRIHMVLEGTGYIPCERCGDPSGTDRETYERVKPEHIFCSDCRTTPCAENHGLVEERAAIGQYDRLVEQATMSGPRFFTNTRAFEGQDLNDLRQGRIFQPEEYWIIWPAGSTGFPEAGEEGWREATEKEFRARRNDTSAIQHTIQATEVIHSRAKCNVCFERIPLGQEFRFTENAIDYVWCKRCANRETP